MFFNCRSFFVQIGTTRIMRVWQRRRQRRQRQLRHDAEQATSSSRLAVVMIGCSSSSRSRSEATRHPLLHVINRPLSRLTRISNYGMALSPDIYNYTAIRALVGRKRNPIVAILHQQHEARHHTKRLYVTHCDVWAGSILAAACSPSVCAKLSVIRWTKNFRIQLPYYRTLQCVSKKWEHHQ